MIDVGEVKRRLQALLNDANLVNEYIRQYGPGLDIKNIKILKEQRARLTRTNTEDKGQDPVFEIKAKCPVCNQEDIPCYELRAKSQAITQNKFLVPEYKGANGYRTLDYTLIAVTVCPRCLFASPDKKDFIRQTPGVAGEVKSQLTSNILMTLQEKIGERKALIKAVSDYASYFRIPRLDDAAITSYRLAIYRARTEAWYEQPYALYKMGAYALRIAKIIKECGLDNREFLREALMHYEESFRASNCPSEEIEHQVIYTIVAIYLKLEDTKKARSYLSVFTNLQNARALEKKSTEPATNTALLDKWVEKANALWDYREEADFFKNE